MLPGLKSRERVEKDAHLDPQRQGLKSASRGFALACLCRGPWQSPPRPPGDTARGQVTTPLRGQWNEWLTCASCRPSPSNPPQEPIACYQASSALWLNGMDEAAQRSGEPRNGRSLGPPCGTWSTQQTLWQFTSGRDRP